MKKKSCNEKRYDCRRIVEPKNIFRQCTLMHYQIVLKITEKETAKTYVFHDLHGNYLDKSELTIKDCD